ncbi:MAG: hypothetical protein DRJ55_00975 [Thermoprotei archaeon]|nr:MAG: hypothetical protein DRJ46_04240 [Thermoprotei archaeon]RLE95874.1 MAG: hypothetical protein DRJ55_00975 [Thermoprotei archaeon]
MSIRYKKVTVVEHVSFDELQIGVVLAIAGITIFFLYLRLTATYMPYKTTTNMKTCSVEQL